MVYLAVDGHPFAPLINFFDATNDVIRKGSRTTATESAFLISFNVDLFYNLLFIAKHDFSCKLCVGTTVGTVIGMPVSGLLCQYFGWESVFYAFGENYLSYALYCCNRYCFAVVRFCK